MYKFCPVLVLSGESFTPIEVEEKLNILFSSKNEVGEIGYSGVNKNKSLNYGSATLCPPEEINDSNNYYSGFNWLVDILEDVVQAVREYGADEIYLDLGVFSSTPPNLSFEPETLAKLSKANISFWISVMEMVEKGRNREIQPWHRLTSR